MTNISTKSKIEEGRIKTFENRAKKATQAWYKELHKPHGIFDRMKLDELGWRVWKAERDYFISKT